MTYDMREGGFRSETGGPRARLAWRGVAALAALTLACASAQVALAEEGPADGLPTEGPMTEELAPAPEVAPEGAGVPDGTAAELVGDEAADAAPSVFPDAEDGTAAAADAEVTGSATDQESADAANAPAIDPAGASQLPDEQMLDAPEGDPAVAVVTDEAPARAMADPTGDSQGTQEGAGSDAGDQGTPTDAGEEPAHETPRPPSTGWWVDPATGDTYYYKNGSRQRGWVVTRLGTADNARGDKRRYWLDASYRLARGRVIDPTSAADKLKGCYLAYARPDGSVVTGSYRSGKRIYLADKTGHLAKLSKRKKRGWLDSKRYDAKGKARRYYLYRGADGSYYAVVGFAKTGYAHYTTKRGYVRTGVWKSGKRIFVASEKGKLAMLKKASRKRGWLKSSSFGQGSQRYYLYRETKGAYQGMFYATKGYSKDGYAHYTTKRGYVTCKDGVKVKGRWYLASDRGKLERASKAQIRMVKQAWETPATGTGLCALWVENVAVRAGLPRINADACDLYRMYGRSADMRKIKPGTIISVSTHSHTWAGSIWGHVGVYVGDGKVRDSVTGSTRTTKLSWWTRHYGTTVPPKWGWMAGRVL